MALTLAQKARIRAELMAKGIYWTDAQIEAHAESLDVQPPPPSEARVEYPTESVDRDAGLKEHLFDAIGSTLWSFADVGTFGGAGAAWRSLDRESYEDVMMAFQDTASGRIGGTLGGLAGFMLPMGWIGRGTSAAVRSIRGLRQGKALKLPMLLPGHCSVRQPIVLSRLQKSILVSQKPYLQMMLLL